MKKILTLLICILFLSQHSWGQSNPRIVKAKKMFFSEELNLSMSQIESFWPTYEMMRTDLMKIAKEKKIACNDPQHLESCLEKDEKYIQVRNKYLLNISNKIGRDKAMRIPNVEKDFVKMVRKGMNNR